MERAFQDFYPEQYSHCYGCGVNNPYGHHLKSYWLDEARTTTIAVHKVDSRFCGGVPGHVYGGMVASLLDCHGTASAAAFQYRHLGRSFGDGGGAVRFVTASLNIEFVKPTPIEVELDVRGCLLELQGRKCRLQLTLEREGQVFARAEMLAVQL